MSCERSCLSISRNFSALIARSVGSGAAGAAKGVLRLSLLALAPARFDGIAEPFCEAGRGSGCGGGGVVAVQ